MRRTSPFALLLAAALGAIAGCRDLTAPVPVGSTFVLVRVGNDTLPTATSTVPGGWIELGDTLVFVGETGAASGTVDHHETGIPPNLSPTSFTYERFYNWDGRALHFYPPPCPPNADCARALRETGILADGYLVITYDDPSLRSRTYRRTS